MKPRVHGCIGRVHGRKAVIDPDIVYDDRKVVGIDCFTNDLLGAGEFLFGNLEAGAGGGLDIDDKLPRVRLREIREAQQGVERQAGEEDYPEDRQHPDRPAQYVLHRDFVSRQHPLKEAIETVVEARAPSRLSAERARFRGVPSRR